jgi:anti-sigma regulatory factor (Ser/Thr protein kinase)
MPDHSAESAQSAPSVLRAHLPREAASVRAARQIVASALDGSAVPNEKRQDVVLLTSEVATNALVHAGSAFDLSLSLEAGTVRVEVHDDGGVFSPSRAAGPGATAGRGLALLEVMADRWGTRDEGALGKVVWFELGVAER